VRFDNNNDPGRRREAVDEHAYLIRYGVMGHIGKFAVLPGCDTPLERDQLVVIQTHRGIELGEVLVPVGGSSALAKKEPERSVGPSTEHPHVIRPAGLEDVTHRQQSEELRASRFALCQRILHEGDWPLELIDVEPLLDGNATVLHYLGPHQFDTRPLRAWFRMACDLEVVPEPFGVDPEGELPDWMTETDDDEVESSCGNGDCGAGGCGTKSESSATDAHAKGPASNGCAPTSHGGCASCGISRLRKTRNHAAD
jgi:PSP1 C-terminal conserved region